MEGIAWYEVMKDDNLSKIAQIWNVPLDSLMRANPSVEGPEYIIHPGDRLLIPAS